MPIDDPERYQHAGEQGRGGLGRVVRAVDKRLGRTVAVKELLRLSPSHEQLFMREALITARLQHPGIVPVLEAGRWPDGAPYYVMKLVEGQTLKQKLGEATTLGERMAYLPNVLAVAEAIAYAHKEQVIHRDLKPANVVVGEFGETVVIDWGLARDGKADASQLDGAVATRADVASSRSTVSGKVIGTPQYMPPEQARGDLVDARGDVYALGAMLYEVLAGAPPYAGADSNEVLDRVLAGPPPPLANLARNVAPDLLAIVAKAMARQPAERYASAKELADDLRRFQTGQLVTAHHYRTGELVRRWISRHRGSVAVAMVGVVVLVLAATGFIRRIVDERNAAQFERARAEQARDASRHREHELVILQAEAALRRDPTAAVAWLKLYPQAAPDQRRVTDLLDNAVASGVARHVWRTRDWVLDAAFSPDGKVVATGSKDGEVRLHDVATGGERRLGHVDDGVMSVAFSPTGDRLATGGAAGSVTVWSLGDGSARPLGRHKAAIRRLAFSSDGQELLVEGERSEASRWNLATGDRRDVLASIAEPVLVAIADRDWSQVVVSTAGGGLHLVTGDHHEEIARLGDSILFLGISPDGKTAFVHGDNQAQLIDVATRKVTTIARQRSPVAAVAFASDGRVAYAGEDNAVVIFDGRKIMALRGHTDAIYQLAFSRDGARLLVASDDGTARVWDLAHGGSQVLRGHDDDVYSARFSPDETLVVTASLDGSARLWPLARQEKALLAGGTPIASAVPSDHGAVVTSSYFGGAKVWDLATRTTRELIPDGPSISLWRAVPAADGHLAARFREGGDIELYRDGRRERLLTGLGRGSALTFSPDAATLYAADRRGAVIAYSTVDGRPRTWRNHGEPVWDIVVSPTGDRILVGSGPRLALYDRAGAEVASVEIGSRTGWFCAKGRPIFDGTSQRVAVARCGGEIVLWDPANGALRPLEVVGHHPSSLALSPDGSLLAAAMVDRTVRLWDTASGRLIRTLRGHGDLVHVAAFSPDGDDLATASYDRTVRIWHLATTSARVLRGHEGSVDAVVWTADGDGLVSASRDGTLRLWPTPRQTVTVTTPADLEAITTAIVDQARPTTPRAAAAM